MMFCAGLQVSLWAFMVSVVIPEPIPPLASISISLSLSLSRRGLAMMHWAAFQGFRALLSCVVIPEPPS